MRKYITLLFLKHCDLFTLLDKLETVFGVDVCVRTMAENRKNSKRGYERDKEIVAILLDCERKLKKIIGIK